MTQSSAGDLAKPTFKKRFARSIHLYERAELIRQVYGEIGSSQPEKRQKVTAAAAKVGLKKQTAYSVIRKYLSDGKLVKGKDTSMVGRKKILDEQQLALVLSQEFLIECCGLSLE